MILAKRLLDKEKILIVELFKKGATIDSLAKEFECTNSTISRNLKKNLGEEKYKDFINQNKKEKNYISELEKNKALKNNGSNKLNFDEKDSPDYSKEELKTLTEFTEIVPLNYEIENTVQKDLSSVPIADVTFPKTVYMIVDKKIELETKYLKEYPEWQFLSQEELNRKTIEIFFDLKIAKRTCRKEQKVIKVPNTDVFKIVAPLLLNRGISRIVSTEKLISL